MRICKRTLAAIALTVLTIAQAFAFTGTTAQAATIDDTFVTFKDNKNYRVLPLATGLPASEDALAYMLPEVMFTRLDKTYNYGGQEMLENTYAAQVYAEVAFVDAWIAANIQAIVPDGSTYYAAVSAIEAWLQNNVRLTTQNATDRSYYSAYHAFADGTGISATYACAFNSLMHALPFDATGNVNYAAGTSHVQTTVVTNVNRSWSGIYTGAGWLYYDVEWKANGHGDSKTNTVYEAGSADETFGSKVHWVKN